MTTIKVDARHRANGIRGDSCNCPVANAIKDVVRPGVGVVVTHGAIYVGHEEIETPDWVDRWVCDFDDGKPCEDVAFDLPIPDRYLANP